MEKAQELDLRQLESNVREALKQWHGDSSATSPLASLYLFRQTALELGSTTRQATNQVLLKALKVLGETHEAAAQLIQMRFLDLMSISQLANKLNVAESTVFTLQRTAIRQLAGALANLERIAGSEQRTTLQKRLPAATYVNLLGVEEQLGQLVSLLAPPQPPWLVAIEGIGGIGKTSLAHALASRLIRRAIFDELGWVSGQQSRLNLVGAFSQVETGALNTESLIEKLYLQLLPSSAEQGANRTERMFAALLARLKEVPHLIVVDNLETLADVESLLPTLQQLANPTKFVLTSRESVYAEPNIYHVPIRELSQSDALKLVHQEAALSNLPVLATSSDTELMPIVETVGGNPLAIRLVVGQTHTHSLEAILADLRAAQSQTIENLYSFIYRAAWDRLDDLSRRVLLLMPLANPQGDELDYLANVSGLTSGELRQALNHLVRLNLVDARGGLNDRRFSIHSLTRTFLLHQVAKWQ